MATKQEVTERDRGTLATVAARPARYVRIEELDKRIRRGDDYAGDAWRDTTDGSIRWVTVGYDLATEEGIIE